MNAIYKYFPLSFALVAAMIFSVPAFAVAAAETKVTSFVQTKPVVKRKSKPRRKITQSIVGGWSGNHVSLKISGSGAVLDFDCASGAIGERIILDKKSGFDAPGTFTEEHGGPVRLNEQSEGVAVRYNGRVNGKTMTLTVRSADGSKTIETFTLIYGREPNLRKCR